jgi:hypothetical protein
MKVLYVVVPMLAVLVLILELLSRVFRTPGDEPRERKAPYDD